MQRGTPGVVARERDLPDAARIVGAAFIPGHALLEARGELVRPALGMRAKHYSPVVFAADGK